MLILEAGDLGDWVADREELLVAAWTPEITSALSWEATFAEAMAGELHAAMLSTMLRNGTATNFLGLIGRSNTGLETSIEKAVAGRFFDVTLKLARAASRRAREDRSRKALPFIRTSVVGDGRTNPGHLALAGILLPYDHPFWQRRHPPLDMDCRCGAIPVTWRQLEREGWSVTTEHDLAEREAAICGEWPAAFRPLLDFRAAPVSEQCDA